MPDAAVGGAARFRPGNYGSVAVGQHRLIGGEVEFQGGDRTRRQAQVEAQPTRLRQAARGPLDAERVFTRLFDQQFERRAGLVVQKAEQRGPVFGPSRTPQCQLQGIQREPAGAGAEPNHNRGGKNAR